jgi:hypothetical protein
VNWQEFEKRPEPKRDQYGRYLIQGKPYTRATTWAATVDERSRLEKWQQRMVLRGVLDRKDILLAAAADRDDDKKLNRLCDQAIEAAKGSAAASIGTSLHSLTEQLDLGREPVVPHPWDLDLLAYAKTLADSGVTIIPEHIERVVVHHGLGVAGTFDRLVEWDGRTFVADLKTGGFLPWQTIAIQLALYAHADELYEVTSDTCGPMPFVEQDQALVIHLPEGQACCTLYLVDIAAGWEMAQVCGTVRDWRKRKNLATPLEQTVLRSPDVTPADAPGDPELRDWLARRIQNVKDGGVVGELLAAWPNGIPTLKQSDDHTAHQLARIEDAVHQVEQAHDLPLVPRVELADREDRQAMQARCQALPDTLRAVVETAARVEGLPHVLKMTATQLSRLGVIVAETEAAHIRGAA